MDRRLIHPTRTVLAGRTATDQHGTTAEPEPKQGRSAGMADELDKAREAEGTHAPTVEVDPTNELLDGDDKPLPADLEEAGVVIDESGTRLVHTDPDLVPGPDSNLELKQLQHKHLQGLDPVDVTADEVRALREEHEGLTRRAQYAAKGDKVHDRIKQVVEQLNLRGAEVEAGQDEGTDVEDSERAGQAERAAKERAAAAKATGKDVPAEEAPKGRTARKRTTA